MGFIGRTLITKFLGGWGNMLYDASLVRTFVLLLYYLYTRRKELHSNNTFLSISPRKSFDFVRLFLSFNITTSFRLFSSNSSFLTLRYNSCLNST